MKINANTSKGVLCTQKRLPICTCTCVCHKGGTCTHMHLSMCKSHTHRNTFKHTSTAKQESTQTYANTHKHTCEHMHTWICRSMQPFSIMTALMQGSLLCIPQQLLFWDLGRQPKKSRGHIPHLISSILVQGSTRETESCVQREIRPLVLRPLVLRLLTLRQ